MDRNLLKANWDLLEDFVSDQTRDFAHPPVQKPLTDGTPVVPLPAPEANRPSGSLADAVDRRRSIRKFTGDPVAIGELSWLLWATQGIQKVIRDGVATLRPVPSGGARHPFETYLFVNRVSGLEPGLYRYLPLDHALARLGDPVPPEEVTEGCHGQTFAGSCPVCFAWTALPYRTEWRYGPVSHKIILLDAGHVCQNLYLACTAMGLGTCAIGAYDQARMDSLLGLDGEEEMVVYMAPVGRPG
jgi:SagB-type dehydrogenase family enzyme